MQADCHHRSRARQPLRNASIHRTAVVIALLACAPAHICPLSTSRRSPTIRSIVGQRAINDGRTRTALAPRSRQTFSRSQHA
eukprot:3867875-Pleurochrysis_carterae.AAC.1